MSSRMATSCTSAAALEQPAEPSQLSSLGKPLIQQPSGLVIEPQAKRRTRRLKRSLTHPNRSKLPMIAPPLPFTLRSSRRVWLAAAAVCLGVATAVTAQEVTPAPPATPEPAAPATQPALLPPSSSSTSKPAPSTAGSSPIPMPGASRNCPMVTTFSTSTRPATTRPRSVRP